MANENKSAGKVPNLRFPEFEGEWENTTLSMCAESLDYGMNAAAMKFDGKNRYIRITDIDESSSVYKSDAPVSPKADLSDKYLVQEGDILFARTGAGTGRTYLYNTNDGKLYFAGFLIRARIKKDYSAHFIFTQTQTSKYDKWVKLMSMRSGQPGINSQEYASFKFKIPTKEEQDKISKLLFLIDSRIQTQNKILQHYQSLMQNLRDAIFKQKISFKDSDGNPFPSWGIYKLKDIAERVVRKNSDNIQNILTISAQHGLISQLDFFNKSVSSKNVEGYYLLAKGDFAYNKSYSTGYPMGAIKRLNRYNQGIVSTLYICFRFNKKVNEDFMEHYFESQIQNIELEKIAQEGARNHGLLNVGVSDFFNIKVQLPSVKEQVEIAKLLSSLGVRLNIEYDIMKKLKTQKNYLLKNLFI
jgi:type I restriction enzyme S subunit